MVEEIKSFIESCSKFDNLSANNHINNTTRPLMIDPQGQANKWVKNLERDNNLVVAKPVRTDVSKLLEVCLTFGKPLLLENVGEELDPSYDPVFLKATYMHGCFDVFVVVDVDVGDVFFVVAVNDVVVCDYNLRCS